MTADPKAISEGWRCFHRKGSPVYAITFVRLCVRSAYRFVGRVRYKNIGAVFELARLGGEDRLTIL